MSRKDTTDNVTFRDTTVTCPHCGRKMVPRIVFERKPAFSVSTPYTNRPAYSICPFCMQVYSRAVTTACFVATAVYGSYHHPCVVALRRFRDQKLLRTAWGRAFVCLYYKLSPPFARFLSHRRIPRLIVRQGLGMFVKTITKDVR